MTKMIVPNVQAEFGIDYCVKECPFHHNSDGITFRNRKCSAFKPKDGSFPVLSTVEIFTNVYDSLRLQACIDEEARQKNDKA